MIVYLEDLARIAEIEFSNIVDGTEMVETKLRIKANAGQVSTFDISLNKCQMLRPDFQAPDVNRETLRKDLNDLINKKVIIRKGEKKGIYYEII